MDDIKPMRVLVACEESHEAAKRLTERGELLPCPFCGGKAKSKTQIQPYGISGTIIKCTQCLSSVYCLDEYAQITENGMKNVPINNHVFLASYRWNARAPILTPEELEKLEKLQ